VMRYLEEHKIGFKAGPARVPIVPAAILFDLDLGRADRRPDAAMGYAAASTASPGLVAEGNVGAGTGASVGKVFGKPGAMKSGLGTSSLEIGGGVVVGAVAAVNAFGDVINPATGQIVAGARPSKIGPLKLGGTGTFANTLEVLKTIPGRAILSFASRSNTVIAVVASNARFDKAQTTKVAQMAQDGLARSIRPAHTMLDGDTIFALSTGEKKTDVSLVGIFSAEVLAQAILRAVQSARPAGGLPAMNS